MLMLPDTLLLTKKIEKPLQINGVVVVQFTDRNTLISGINRLKNIILFRNKYKYSINKHSTREIEEIIASCNFKILAKEFILACFPFFFIIEKWHSKKGFVFISIKINFFKAGF